MPDMAQAAVRELADFLLAGQDDYPPVLRKGVIDTVNPLTAKIGGSAVAVPVQATGPKPVAGAVVWVLESGPRRILLTNDASGVVTSLGSLNPAALPRTYPAGLSIGFSDPATYPGAWPSGVYGQVHTQRIGNDLAQTLHAVFPPALAGAMFQRTSASQADAWTPWAQYGGDTGPIALPVSAGITTAYAAPFYGKDGQTVYFEGSLNAPAHGTVIATLPAGFRPRTTLRLLCVAGTATPAQIDVQANGSMTAYWPNGILDLASLRFKAYQ
jgi:hypothetical protein